MISVCMATYNGEKFIKDQLDSIINQLDELSEIIIVDDFSTDMTTSIIESIKDNRIILLKNQKNLGVVLSFEKAIRNSKNEIVFLCDQDDIWLENKVKKILQNFQNNKEISLIFGNGILIDEKGTHLGRNLFKNKVYDSFIRHLIQPRFLGCSIAFKKSFENKIFPFPKSIPMHDWWIGMNHIAYGKVKYLDEPLIKYRRHENTVTTGKNAPLPTMIYWRYKILINFIINYFKK